ERERAGGPRDGLMTVLHVNSRPCAAGLKQRCTALARQFACLFACAPPCAGACALLLGGAHTETACESVQVCPIHTQRFGGDCPVAGARAQRPLYEVALEFVDRGSQIGGDEIGRSCWQRL